MAFYNVFLLSLLLSFGCSQSNALLAEKTANEVPQTSQAEPPECECCVIRDAPANLSHQAVIFPE